MTERLAQILAQLNRTKTPTLEQLLTGPEFFALTKATPLQRAICRVADGKPLAELATEQTVIDALGDPSKLPHGKPGEITLVSAIRAGKSLLAAALGVYWSQTCDVTGLGAGEMPRVSIVSLKVDLAAVVFGHIVGNIMARPALSKLLVQKPGSDSVILRHPSGRPVEIKVVAGSRAGASLVARWSAGAIFDEAPRMVGQSEGVINYDDARGAVLARLLPGAQIISIGSPWAPFGPIFDQVQKYWKKPTENMVVIRAPGPAMNPTFWTEERSEGLKKSDPDVWLTECAAEFSSPEESLYNHTEITSATREQLVLEPEPGYEYTAAMDPATRGNSWTFVISTRHGDRRIVVLAKQWTGTKLEPLKPAYVLGEIAAICRDYGIRGVWSDQYMGDALKDIGASVMLPIWLKPMTDRERSEKYMSLKTLFGAGKVELPPDPYLRSDLMRVKKRPRGGGVQIVLPQTSDGRHCDFAPAVVLSLSRYLDDFEAAKPVDPLADAKAEEEKMLKAALKRWGRSRRRVGG